MNGRRATLVGAIVAALGVAVAAGWALRAPPEALDRVRRGEARTSAGGEQTIQLESVGGAYSPNVVHVRAGAPIRLRVTVRDTHGCATRLLVPDLGVDLALAPGGTAEAIVAPVRPGAYVFTCAEKMVKGTIIVE